MGVTTDLLGKRILILGAGHQQVPLILRARARGAYVVVSDESDIAPGVALADRHLCFSIYEVERLIAAVDTYGLEAVTTIGTDQAMVVVAKVANACGLNCHLTPVGARIATNKEAMGKSFHKRNVPMPKRVVVRCGDLPQECAQLSLPLVVKPCDSQGQKGVTRVKALKDLGTAVASAKRESRNGTVIVEEFIQGPEVTASAWVEGGDVIWIALTDRVTFNPDPFLGIAFQHVFPSYHSCSQSNAIRESLYRVLSAFGMQDGPIYAQMIVNNNEFRVIEAAARVGGGNEAALFQATLGINLLDATLNLAFGLSALHFFPKPENPRHGVINFIMANPGVIASQSRMQDLVTAGHIDDGGWYRAVGYEQQLTQDAYARIGWFIVSAETREETLIRARSAYGEIGVMDMLGRSMLFWPKSLSGRG